MVVVARNNKTSLLTNGKEYEVLKIEPHNNRVKVRNDNDAVYWYSLNNFEPLGGKTVTPFIVSISDVVYINAHYRRKIFSDWVFLGRGDSDYANRLTALVFQGNVKKLEELLGWDNLDDIKYWIKVLTKKGLINPSADINYIQSVFSKSK